MGLKDKLTKKGEGSPLSKNNGGKNEISPGATEQSKLQFTYSLNGRPHIAISHNLQH